MNNNSLIVLKALLQSSEREIEIISDLKISIQRSENNTPIICIPGTQNGEKFYLPIDLSLNNFIEYCEKMNPKQVSLIAASITLTKIKTS